MENREQQILSEIKNMMGTIRAQLEMWDAKMAELQQCVDPEDFDNNPIELEIDDVAVDVVQDDVASETVAVQGVIEDPVQVDEPEDMPEYEEEDMPEAELEESESEPEEFEPEPVECEPEPEPESELEPESEPEPEVPAVVEEEEDDDDLPGVFDQPLPVYAAAQASPKVKPSVAEVMADAHPWRTDMPGTPVKDVRSAISLNDRIIFINHLFDEDPMAFQNVITQINTMTSLDQVEEYLRNGFPSWDFSSELVYRFMMAVRRRVK